MSTDGGGAQQTRSRSAILDVVRAAGTISRVELTRATGLTGATVSTVVRRLIDEGLIVEVGRAESTGGKPRTLLRLEPLARFAVGVHLDIGGITYVIANLGGGVVTRWRTAGTGSDAAEEIVDRVAREVDDMMHRVDVERDRVLGVGVVGPGPLSYPAAAWTTTPEPARLAGFALVDALESALGMPVLLDNDATAAAVGEYWSGGIESTSSFGALHMAAGVGAGVLVDGSVYRGSSSNAGEIGHVCVDLTGPECWCGARGCVEAVAGPAAVVAAARARGVDLGPAGRPATEDFGTLARAALRGDAVASSLLTFSARYLAVAAQTLAAVMDLDHIVLTGPAFAVAGSLYLPVIEEHLQRTFFARSSHGLRVRLSSSAHEAAAIGAAALVLQSELVPRPSAVRMPAEYTVASSVPAGG
ncbi:ROK family transcriptional regulator [Occultella gossypii]|uniref:ROK family transcriptional regulator n=1 Tax=Occultella gossypii TaxID=2800820 RepID=A0ABS7S7A8_9MICO|nr:ROK family transcriptional regulator [Occultella gossypii]MBZ2196229.1 ROK family transcriptional regulator [Occultella gossypii]